MSLAKEYFSRVLSPWAPGVDNPLLERLAALPGPRRLAVEVGSGPGVLLCLLAQSFDRVVAVDRDLEMIEAATELVARLRARGAPFGEVELVHADWASCEPPRGADLVCAVNSVLEPHPARRAAMLELFASSLAAGGTFLGVFPAMEAQVHLLRLFAAELGRKGLGPADVAREIEEELIVAHRFDALAGTFASRDEPAQKFYYQMELGFELVDAGLEVLESTRVVYPWEVCREVDAGYFPGETELWDWFVRARRP